MNHPTRYLAFDLEIATPIPDFKNWKTHRPIPISAAALAYVPDGQPTDDPTRILTRVETYSQQPHMDQATARQLAARLLQFQENGYQIVTWNGAGFDFQVLADATGDPDLCQDLAWRHVDLMFNVYTRLGYPIGLDAAARGAGLDGKPAGMDGAQAPILWQQGEIDQVIAYVESDARQTLQLAYLIDQARRCTWITRRGKPRSVIIDPVLPVESAARLPEKRPYWLTDPIPRSEFIGWIERPQPSGSSYTPAMH